VTLTIVPGTPLATQAARGDFTLPSVEALLGELRTFVAEARPTDALFRTNHASNYLPVGGRLPRDGARLTAAIDRALSGGISVRRPRESRVLGGGPVGACPRTVDVPESPPRPGFVDKPSG